VVLQAGPRKELRSRNVVLGAAVGAGGAILASSGGRFGRGRAWGDPGVALGRCGRLDRAEMRLATAVGGAPGRRPR
jgi:hypothetical protein